MMSKKTCFHRWVGSGLVAVAMPYFTVLFMTLVMMLFCSCNGIVKERKEPASEPVKSLDQFSVEQLRMFIKGHTAGDWRNDTEMHRGTPPPPIQKPYSKRAKFIDLVKPQDFKCGSMSILDVINQRRSRREYTGDSFTNEELSYLLWCTQGISAIEKNENGDVDYHLRTVPSGGARHPFETYLIINRVEGIKPGLYRFLAVEHKLLCIKEDEDIAGRMQTACFGQTHIRDAAVVFIWSAIPYRTEWKYGCIAHKLIAMDAGHVCQNLYLAAESIGAGACANLGYHQKTLDELLGFDGKDEFAIYTASVGKVK